MELTEDLAAVCKSYMDTIQEKDTRVIERIAKFGERKGEGHKFYRKAASDAQYAVDALGLQVADSAKEHSRKNFEKIHKAREQWWDWTLATSTSNLQHL